MSKRANPPPLMRALVQVYCIAVFFLECATSYEKAKKAQGWAQLLYARSFFFGDRSFFPLWFLLLIVEILLIIEIVGLSGFRCSAKA